MHALSSHKRLFVFLFTLCLIAAYASFLTADIVTGNSEFLYSRIVKYACILTCFSLTLLIGNNGHDHRDTMLLRLAFLLTAMADFSIGILGKFQLGIAIFFFVQITYIVRHSRNFVWNRKEIVSAALVYGMVAFLLVFIGPLLWKAGPMIFFPAIIYCTALATSLWMGIGALFRGFYPRTIAWFIAIGMGFFFLCDLNVGLFNALEQDGRTLFFGPLPIRGDELTSPLSHEEIAIAIPYTLRSIVGILVWFFYLPAQFLLSLSGYSLPFLRSVYPVIPALPNPDKDRQPAQ